LFDVDFVHSAEKGGFSKPDPKAVEKRDGRKEEKEKV